MGLLQITLAQEITTIAGIISLSIVEFNQLKLSELSMFRNPSGEYSNPWCYKESDGKWEDCSVPMCADGTSSSTSTSSCPATTSKLQVGTECLKGGKFGMDYRGTVSVGKGGGICKMWTSSSSYYAKREERGSGPHNYCRNPSEHPNPWCYVFPSGWQDCEIPACTHLEEGTGGHGNFRRWMNLFYYLTTERKMSASAITTAVARAKMNTTFKYTSKGNQDDVMKL